MSDADGIYDPTTNPRHLIAARAAEPTLVDAGTWADLHTDLSTAGDILETISSRGWAHVVERIKRQMDAARRVTERGDVPAEIHRAQGAIQACEWLLNLPEQMSRERQRLVRAIESSQLVDE